MNPEALATALLASDRPALTTVWCPSRAHRLGKVYSTPTGAVLAVPGFGIEPADLFPDRPAGGAARYRTWAYPLDGEPSILARCSDGTWLIVRSELRHDVERARRTGQTTTHLATWTGHPC